MTEEQAHDDAVASGIPGRLINAAITLMATEGPSAIKARTVAAAAGMSTMVVYNYFGGVPELLNAVVDHGFDQIGDAFSNLDVTEDPIADLFAMALTTLAYARANPHLYDAMFGLSTRATYRPTTDKGVRLVGHSPAFNAAYTHVTDACTRLASTGQMSINDPFAVAGALWSFVHGYITLELANHFSDFKDPVRQILVPMAVTFCTGLGADPEAALRSHERAIGRVALPAA